MNCGINNDVSCLVFCFCICLFSLILKSNFKLTVTHIAFKNIFSLHIVVIRFYGEKILFSGKQQCLDIKIKLKGLFE